MSGNGDCLFCKIIAGTIPAQVAYQDEHVVAFHDISPQAPRHVLICPRTHIATLNDVTANEETLVGHAVRVASLLAQRFGDAEEGYRVVINCQSGAGQSVFHVHVHLLGGRAMAWPPG